MALQTLCSALKIDSLNENDYEFLTEYVTIIRPIANGITILEGDKQMCGAYLPVLFGIKKRLNFIESNANAPIKHCNALLQAVKNGLKTRFGAMMDPLNVVSIPLYVAMLSNPKFKMNFIPPDVMRPAVFNSLKTMLIRVGENILATEDELMQNEMQVDVENENGTYRCMLFNIFFLIAFHSIVQCAKIHKNNSNSVISF